MPIDFEISKLHIKNFRGIKDFELEIPNQQPCFLIGANNSGKSTVLAALALVLKGGGLHQYQVEEYDFFHSNYYKIAEEFNILMEFSSDMPDYLPAVQGVGDPITVNGVLVKGKVVSDNRFDYRHLLIDPEKKPITYSTRTPLKGKKKERFADHGLGWHQPYARLDEIRGYLPEVWYLKPDNLWKSLYDWRTGPLKRLASILTKKFLEHEWEFEFDDKKRKMPETMERVYGFFKSAVAEFPFWKEDLKPRLEHTLSEYIGRDAGIELNPNIQRIEDWVSQQLALAFSAEADCALTPMHRMGDGWQSLVRLASLEVLSDMAESATENTLILYEEPETYLHPHLRRKLRDVLEKLSKKGWTILCSTHAPEFISFNRQQRVTRLWRYKDDVIKGEISSERIPDAVKFQELIDERGNQELLFANKVIFCEGKDDYFAVKLYSDKKGVDLDGKSVTILDVGGAGNIPLYSKIAKELKIPWCALTDEDIQDDGSVKPATEQIRNELKDIISEYDTMPIWSGSLERSLGITSHKATPDWQHKNIATKSIEEIKSYYPDYAKTAEEIINWMT